MYALFEEGSSIKCAALLTQQVETWQAQIISGKHLKIKSKQIILQFNAMDPVSFMSKAQELAKELDINFLWECASTQEFHFLLFSNEYFGAQSEAYQQAALLFALYAAPIYFRRKGGGLFQKAESTQLANALAAIERKKTQLELQNTYECLLKERKLPEAFRGQEISLLFKPDKNSIEFKALSAAAQALNLSPMKLLIEIGAIDSAKALHEAKFFTEHFSGSIGFADISVISLTQIINQLPLSKAQAFSIDDATTTEIDDAFSVGITEDGMQLFGIHIAAPGFGINHGDNIDKVARNRLSTVYCPGSKITMLPESIIDIFTLKAGCVCPVLSLYFTVDMSTLEIKNSETKIEKILITDNLRLNHMESLVTAENLEKNFIEAKSKIVGENLEQNKNDYPCKSELMALWPFVLHLHAEREKIRLRNGLKPSNNTKTEYSYYLDTDAHGQTQISIVPRMRNSPLDKIVAELMILTNSTWAKLLADFGVPGIYRAQRSWGMVRTRMQTTPAPHEGLGVTQYAWSTSPLRRYVDLVNQWQIIAAVKYGITAKMVAPFTPNSTNLMVIAADFDTTYTEYAKYQNTMERYWCLKWLKQEHKKQNNLHMRATVIKDNIARFTDLPLSVEVPELSQQSLIRGSLILLEIGSIDEVELTVTVCLLEILSDDFKEI